MEMYCERLPVYRVHYKVHYIKHFSFNFEPLFNNKIAQSQVFTTPTMFCRLVQLSISPTYLLLLASSFPSSFAERYELQVVYKLLDYGTSLTSSRGQGQAKD